MAHIEENWANLNSLFDDLTAAGGWSQKHGPDWIFADLTCPTIWLTATRRS